MTLKVRLTDEVTALLLDAPQAIRIEDTPVKLSEWRTIAAAFRGAPPPARTDETLARDTRGEMLLHVFDEQPGAANIKARQTFARAPIGSSWAIGRR